MHAPIILLGGMAALLAACDKAETPAAPAEPTSAPAPASGVVREEAAPAPPPAAAPAQAVIQTQPGPKGSSVELNKVAVTGDILTVQLTVRGVSGGSEPAKLDQISVIDDATSRRIGVLKDNDGKWLAGPLTFGSEDGISMTFGDQPSIVWLKFPAPPATSRTVSINIPGIAPFDGVPVAR